MNGLNLIDRLKAARRVAVPLIGVSTPDPAECIRLIRSAFENGAKTPIPIIQWDAMSGLTGLNKDGQAALQKILGNDPGEWPALTANPGAALGFMAQVPGEQREGGSPDGAIVRRGSIVFMLNAHRYFEDSPGRNNGQVVQGIWNLRDLYKGDRRTFVALGPGFSFPPEIAQDVIEFEEPYPTDDALLSIVNEQVKNAGVETLPDPRQKSAVDALRGLAAFTAEQVTAMSVDQKAGDLNVDELWTRKISVIEQTQGLSVDRGPESFDDVRGLANFREFALGLINSGDDAPVLYIRVDEMEKFFGGVGGADGAGGGDGTGVSKDRLGVVLKEMEDNGWVGMITVGHAGTGKSLVTKALANTATKITGRRALSIALDLGATANSLVGASEKSIRNVMRVIKGLAGGRTVCFVATCNGVEQLPVALKRRFTLGTWMFDLPDADERAGMVELNMQKYGLEKQELPDMTDWTGSDIRNVCRVAKLLKVSMVKACQFVTFVAKSDPDAIVRLRRLASGKFVSASRPGTYEAPTENTKYIPEPTKPVKRVMGSEE